MNVRRKDAMTRLRDSKCGSCGGFFTSEFPGIDTDGIPEIGVEECAICGALWNLNEEQWFGDLRGGTGILIREPMKEVGL